MFFSAIPKNKDSTAENVGSVKSAKTAPFQQNQKPFQGGGVISSPPSQMSEYRLKRVCQRRVNTNNTLTNATILAQVTSHTLTCIVIDAIYTFTSVMTWIWQAVVFVCLGDNQSFFSGEKTQMNRETLNNQNHSYVVCLAYGIFKSTKYKVMVFFFLHASRKSLQRSIIARFLIPLDW